VKLQEAINYVKIPDAPATSVEELYKKQFELLREYK